MRKFGVRIRPHSEAVASKNPYRTKEWLVETYVNKKWTLTDCADVAKVSDHTIAKWLAHFGLNIRDINESNAKINRKPDGNTKPTST